MLPSGSEVEDGRAFDTRRFLNDAEGLGLLARESAAILHSLLLVIAVDNFGGPCERIWIRSEEVLDLVADDTTHRCAHQRVRVVSVLLRILHIDSVVVKRCDQSLVHKLRVVEATRRGAFLVCGDQRKRCFVSYVVEITRENPAVLRINWGQRVLIKVCLEVLLIDDSLRLDFHRQIGHVLEPSVLRLASREILGDQGSW